MFDFFSNPLVSMFDAFIFKGEENVLKYVIFRGENPNSL